MQKWIFLFVALLVLVCLVAGPCSRNAGPARGSSSIQWVQGGNLHKATIAEWKNASYQNKLATAADWLAATKWKGHLTSPDDFDRLKSKAQMLANGVDKVTAELPGEYCQAHKIAALLLTMSNDLGP
ncbi:hypothetical protein ES703_45259 [subsurface metagenome]